MAENEKDDCSNNAQLFRIAISNSLKSIAESVSEDEFIEILTILKSNPSTTKKLHKIMIKELCRSMNNDLEDMFSEGSVQDALKKIAKLSEESTTSANEAWRPPGNITLHLRSLDAHKIKEATDDLEKQVNEMEKENENLMKAIVESRSRICASNDHVTKLLDSAPTVLQQLEKTHTQLATSLETIEGE